MRPILRAATIFSVWGLFFNILSAEAATSFSYDKLNRLTGATYADGTSISYTYDAVGNITGTTRTVIPAQTVNGICGNSNGTTSDTVPVAGFCTSGKASLPVGSGPWNWLCQGIHGGQTAGCSAVINYYSLVATTGGTGKGTVTSTPSGINPVGISCPTGPCSSTFPFGTNVSLTATPDQFSALDHWEGDCTPSGATCVATISNSGKSVNAIFTLTAKAMIVPNIPFTTLLEAYNSIQSGTYQTILALFTQDTSTAEGLVINRGSNIILKGGYKAGFQEKSGSPTLLKSPLRVSSGRFTAENIKIVSVAPVVVTFTVPVTSAGATVPIHSLVASDNNGVTGYCVKEVNSYANCSWTTQPPANYTFSSAGHKSLYAFAKNALNQVSISKSATIDVGYQLTVNILGNGSVSGDFACSSPSCSAWFFGSTALSMAALTGSNPVFDNWTGDCTELTGNICDVTMNSIKNITATFH